MAVIDASVWVSICHPNDRHHRRSLRWLEKAVGDDERLCAPTLLPVEVAGAVRRLTGDPALAEEAGASVAALGSVELVELSPERSRRAARYAASAGLRGADAVYLELAASRREPLVTWDRQQLERGGAVAKVGRP